MESNYDPLEIELERFNNDKKTLKIFIITIITISIVIIFESIVSKNNKHISMTINNNNLSAYNFTDNRSLIIEEIWY